MRQVVNKEMVAHLWAHQTQNHARNSGGNFYFDGGDIYSYGSHFRCGSVVENKNGQKAYLITTRGYSNTTAKHMGMVIGAIPFDSTKFYTPRLIRLKKSSMRMCRYDHQEAIFFIIDQLKFIDECIKNQQKSRTVDYSEQVGDALLNIGRWIKFWGLDVRQKSDRDEWLGPAIPKLLSTKKADKDFFWVVRSAYSGYYSSYSENEVSLQNLLVLITNAGLIQEAATNQFESRVEQLFIDWAGDEMIWEKYQARYARQDEINQKARETRERNQAIRDEQRRKEWLERDRISKMSVEERIEKWRSGEIASMWIQIGNDKPFNAILRVRNAMIETSMGITVKIDEALRIWPLIHRFHQNETTFQRDIIRDATNHPWTINAYEDDVMTAGCHRLSYEEMRNCIIQLGISV